MVATNMNVNNGVTCYFTLMVLFSTVLMVATYLRQYSPMISISINDIVPQPKNNYDKINEKYKYDISELADKITQTKGDVYTEDVGKISDTSQPSYVSFSIENNYLIISKMEDEKEELASEPESRVSNER